MHTCEAENVRKCVVSNGLSGNIRECVISNDLSQNVRKSIVSNSLNKNVRESSLALRCFRFAVRITFLIVAILIALLPRSVLDRSHLHLLASEDPLSQVLSVELLLLPEKLSILSLLALLD
ncbi:unnamed protein product [Acanthocheilonema viteae]|uniref:Uncharacterized protein n=1 Tax=Acanthocheilonema viteae TaxID=6277 RepID=A0A498SUR7_ACAVI|nr:unnamed protein product [Acanthocheilonema viteae]